MRDGVLAAERRRAGLVFGSPAPRIGAPRSAEQVAIRALQEQVRKSESGADADRKKLEDALALAAEAVDRVPRRRRGDLESRLDQLVGESDPIAEDSES